MPTRYIQRASTVGPIKGTANAAPIYVDSDDSKIKFVPGGQGSSTEVEVIDASTSQTLTNKTLSSPTITGTNQQGAAAGAAGGVSILSVNKTLTDNTATDFFTVTVPNAIAGASIELFVSSTLGDGDSTDSAIYTIGISRIAGAATKATASSKSVVGATTGATGNAVITAAVSSNTGAVGATQTFTITVKNARSAGSADNHPTTARVILTNNKASGITIAAA